MGAGILPTALVKGKLYFLFGKENEYEKSAPGYSDFGGSTEKNESYLTTATREGAEELTGFLGNHNEIYNNLKGDKCFFDLPNVKYRTFIYSMDYNPYLPYYYNNNQKFLQKKIPNVIKSTKIFEKAHIIWICQDDLIDFKKKCRFFYKPMIENIIYHLNDIKKFIQTKN
jgi:hypothetical protein